MTPEQEEKLDAWLRSVLWETTVPVKEGEKPYGNIDVHRVKGRILREDGKEGIVQGVREVFEIVDYPKRDEDTTEGKLVLIGRHLRLEDLQKSIDGFVFAK